MQKHYQLLIQQCILSIRAAKEIKYEQQRHMDRAWAKINATTPTTTTMPNPNLSFFPWMVTMLRHVPNKY
jgi:hypothetical protein